MGILRKVYLLNGVIAIAAACLIFCNSNAQDTEHLNKIDPLIIYKMANQFVNFTSEAIKASDELNDAKSIDENLDKSSIYLKSETIDGAKAFAMLAALKSEDFKIGLDAEANKIGANELIILLTQNPDKIIEIPGFESAKQYAGAAFGNLEAKTILSAEKITKASYDIQKLNWSKNIIDKKVHMDALDNNYNASTDFAAIDADTIITEGAKITPINNNIIAAAALFQLDNYDGAYTLLKPNSGNFCVKRAFLNIKQCIAATRYPFEHAFCLSKHSYTEPLNCASAAVK